jgi:hypothetical protein
MRRDTLIWAAAVAIAIAAMPGCKKTSGEGSGEHAGQAEGFGQLTVDELEAKMKEAKDGKGALFIFDNNAKAVYDKGHIPGAKWVDHENVKASDLPTDKEATLVFYCANEH